MLAETWFPAMSGNYGIMHKKEDGSVEKIKAYYDNGAKYEDECGYYESERRSARRIENVIAWIGTQFMDTDEWYDRRPLDFSYSPLEELDLGVSAYNLLEQQGFNTICDLLKLPDHAALEKVCNHRKKIIEDVIQHLEAAGFKVDYLK